MKLVAKTVVWWTPRLQGENWANRGKLGLSKSVSLPTLLPLAGIVEERSASFVDTAIRHSRRRKIRRRARQNGAKLRAVWDGFAPRRGRRIQPRVSTLGTLRPGHAP
jgi:hypothetical protein